MFPFGILTNTLSMICSDDACARFMQFCNAFTNEYWEKGNAGALAVNGARLENSMKVGFHYDSSAIDPAGRFAYKVVRKTVEQEYFDINYNCFISLGTGLVLVYRYLISFISLKLFKVYLKL